MSQLKKSLKLWDIVAICVGAMFSSGFFLLPGLAYAHAGPSVFLAYVLSGFFILPSMISQAELCTAMPKAGGTYFFLDRAFGPLIGTIGGIGTFLGLVLKTAFALVGLGAYMQLYTDVSMTLIAVVLAIFFVLLNLVGAKESGRLQKILVGILLVAMTFFIVEGLRSVACLQPDLLVRRFSNFFSHGASEFFYTVAFVFVSYAGLTKVASVAEEVQNPERNIPLGMALSILITMAIYGLGVFVVVGLVPGSELMHDLKPIATAESYAFHWLEEPFGLILVTVAALMAFASTGNAGILAASRYPLAMAKDQLIPKRLAKINRFGVPGAAILVTGALVVSVILTFTEEGIAKFASAFQLLLFIFLNFAVIVMRESRIATYDPGFKSPFYPWTQILGILLSFGLLIYMGTTLLAALLVMVFLFYCWYVFYASKRVGRHGAIHHWFAILGQSRFDPLEEELWDIMKEKGLRKDDPLKQILDQATFIDMEGPQTFGRLVDEASRALARRVKASEYELRSGFMTKATLGAMPVTGGLCMAGLRLIGISQIHLIIIRCPEGFSVQLRDVHGDIFEEERCKLALFLVSPERMARVHLRLMATWMRQAESNLMVDACMLSPDHSGILRALDVEKRMTYIHIHPQSKFAHWAGMKITDLELPPHSLIPIIIRNARRLVPDGNTVIQENDQLILISESSAEDAQA